MQVTGGGAGSSVLLQPELLRECIEAMHEGVADAGQTENEVLVSVKIRSGYYDTTSLESNVSAAKDGGARQIAVHPRTKVGGYSGDADWLAIRRAVHVVNRSSSGNNAVSVFANGDVTTPDRLERCLDITGCTNALIGRGALIDPFIFHRCKAQLSGNCKQFSDAEQKQLLQNFIFAFVDELNNPSNLRGRAKKHGQTELSLHSRGAKGRLKGLLKYLYAGQPHLLEVKSQLLRNDSAPLQEFAAMVAEAVSERWKPPEHAAVNSFSGRKWALSAKSAHNGTVDANHTIK